MTANEPAGHDKAVGEKVGAAGGGVGLGVGTTVGFIVDTIHTEAPELLYEPDTQAVQED